MKRCQYTFLALLFYGFFTIEAQTNQKIIPIKLDENEKAILIDGNLENYSLITEKNLKVLFLN
jgi:hypothetical protein